MAENAKTEKKWEPHAKLAPDLHKEYKIAAAKFEVSLESLIDYILRKALPLKKPEVENE